MPVFPWYVAFLVIAILLVALAGVGLFVAMCVAFARGKMDLGLRLLAFVLVIGVLAVWFITTCYG